MNKDRIEKSKKALLAWHAKLLPEAYEPRSCVVMLSTDVQRLVDDLLDAAMSIEESSRTADAALASIRAKQAA